MKNTLLLALTLTAGTAFAQTPAPAPTAPSTPRGASAAAPAVQVDSRFGAWLGCWRLDDDLTGTGARLCITPAPGGVRMQTIVGNTRGIDELVLPDGVQHEITDPECKGTEQAEWSADGARIFRTTGVLCGKELPRSVRSVAFMAPGPAMVIVQHVSGEMANTAVRVQRYRRAANQKLADGTEVPQPDFSLRSRTTPQMTTWSVEDVIEASGKLPAEVIQAALTEVHHGFDMNRKTLIALDESGVKDEVIDLMVALTYPKKFRVERLGGGGTTAGISTGTGWFDPFMAPMMASPMYDCFTPYGYGYRSYYSMCGNGIYGYNSYGYGYPYYGSGYYPGYGGWVDIGTYPPINPGPAPAPQPDGRAVNGRGYTQIHDRDAEPAPRVSRGANGTAGGYSSGGNGGNASSGGYSSGSASGGSSGGSSSGGDSGARTAVPKGGGGQ